MSLFRKGHRRAHDEAARWVATMRADPLDEERRAFIAWYNSDPSHPVLFHDLDRLWEASARTRVHSRLADPPAAAPKPLRRSPAFAIAAAVIASIGLGALILNSVIQDGQEVGQAPMLLMVTAIGEIREVALPDGSRVTLDTDTAVAVRMNKVRRRIELQKGRARFAVAADPRPFEVAAGGTILEAAAGVFDVSLNSERTAVAALEATVSLELAAEGAAAPPPDRLRLSDNMQVVVGRSGLEPARPLTRAAAAWPKGMLEFDKTPLGEAAAEANRYSRSKILIADPAVAGLEVTGAFRAGDTPGLVHALAAAFGLRVGRSPDGTYRLHPGPR